MAKLIERVEVYKDGECTTFDVSREETAPDFAALLARRVKRICADAGRPYSFLFGWAAIFDTETSHDAKTQLCAALASGEGVTAVWFESWGDGETNVRFDRFNGRSQDVTLRPPVPPPAPVVPPAPEPAPAPGPVPEPAPVAPPVAATPAATPAPAEAPRVKRVVGRPRKVAKATPDSPSAREPAHKMDQTVTADVDLYRGKYVKWWK